MSVHKPDIRSDGYAHAWLDPRELSATLEAAVVFLSTLDFDAIAFRGNSGAVYASPLAIRLNKSLILVRKDTTSTHSSALVEGDKAARTYLIVDDFIASGETVQIIRKEVKRFAPETKYLGTLEMRAFLSWMRGGEAFQWHTRNDPRGKIPKLSLLCLDSLA